MSLISLVLIRSARMYLGVIYPSPPFALCFFFSFFVWDFNVIPASDTISAIYPEGETTALSWATPAMQFPVIFFFLIWFIQFKSKIDFKCRSHQIKKGTFKF